MALTRSLTRLDHPTLETIGEGMEREALLALSQRKLNALGLPVCYIDAQQRYRFVNRAFLDWTGKAQAEVLGREVIEVDGRELYQLYGAYLDAALAGERVSFERQLSSVKRNAFWIRVDYYTDRGPRGDIRGVLATYTDVDNIKRLELEAGAREHRLRIVTDSVGLPIFYFDRGQRLRFANKPYGDYIGIPIDDLLGQPLKNFVAPDALAEMQSYIERAFAGATVSYERRERPASGRAALVAHHAVPRSRAGWQGPAAPSSSSTTSKTISASAKRSSRRKRNCAFSPTTFPAPSPTSTRSSSTRSSTRPSPTWHVARRTRSTARRPTR